MKSGRVLKNMQRSTRLRIFTATVISFATIASAALFVKLDLRPISLPNVAEPPFIKLTNDNSMHQHLATDAFFVPTKYNAKYRLGGLKPGNAAASDGNQIFSELDKIRIFNAFLKNFSESEYWVVSRLNLRSGRGKNSETKSFIAPTISNFTGHDVPLGSIYGAQTLFQLEGDGH
jgi:hypothetical protein